MTHKMNGRVSTYYQSNNFYIVISKRDVSFCETFNYNDTGLCACIILNEGQLKFSDIHDEKNIICNSNELYDLQNLSLLKEYKVDAIKDSYYCTIYKKDLSVKYKFTKCNTSTDVSCDFIIGIEGQCYINNTEISSPFVVKATQKLNIKLKDSSAILAIVDINRE